MTHAPKYWADKLPQELRGEFWGWIKAGFGGETAYCLVMGIGYGPRSGRPD